jgi:hypothetical protein
LVPWVLYRTNPKSTYGCDLLQPFHVACSEGRAAALRTITHLQLYKCQEQGLPYPKQLALLEAADQATALTLSTEQLGGLLEACEQQQLQQDVAALEATLNTILAMEDSCRGAPYTAANSSSSSSKGAGVVLDAPPHAPAAKPTGPRLTHLIVFGVHTKATVQQLVALLDALPYTRHLSQLFLQTSSNYNVLDTSDKDDTARFFGGPWPWETFAAAAPLAVEAAAAPAVGAGSSPPPTHTASTSSTSSRSAAGGGAAPGVSTWRSSCRVFVANMRIMDQMRAPYAVLSDLAPLLEAAQQLQVMGLERADVGALPKCAAHLHSLRALHIRSADISGAGVAGAIAGLTNLRHLGIVWGQKDCALDPVTYIPAAFSALVQLTSLDLSGTYITEQGLEGVFVLPALKQLDLSGSSYLERLPSSISRLTSLEVLKFNDATAVCLPGSMTALTRLRGLEWGSMGGGDDPLQLDVVWRLRSLQHLVLSDDTMTELPAGVAQLTALTQLSVKAPLKKVPDSLTTLADLQVLQLHANPFGGPPFRAVLPQGITELSKLTRVVFPTQQLARQPPAVKAFVQARLVPSSPQP